MQDHSGCSLRELRVSVRLNDPHLQLRSRDRCISWKCYRLLLKNHSKNFEESNSQTFRILVSLY